MARSIHLDPPMMFRFAFYDHELGYFGLSGVTVSPNGHLCGPGTVTVRGAFREPLPTFLAYTGPRDVKVTGHGTASQPIVDDPAFVVHLFGVSPINGKVSPIVWDAMESSVLYLEATLPYDSLIVTSGDLLEQMAAQA